MKFKSILILGCGLIICFKAFSQNANVQSAENYLNDGKMTLAQKYIDLAAADDNTGQKAKTWYVRGVVYQTLAEDTSKPAPPADFDIAVQSYEKATLLDSKKDYTDKMLYDLMKLRIDYYNMGIKFAFKEDYTDAHPYYSKALAISNFLSSNYEIKTLDTLSMFNVAFSNLMTKTNLDSAKAMFLQLADFKYNSSKTYSNFPHSVYGSLFNVYLQLKDTASAQAIVKKAEQLLPTDESFVLDDVNIALWQKRPDDAITGLKSAIQYEPNNGGYYYILGNCYRQKGDMTNAEASYRKAIELNPNDAVNGANAEFALGVLYYNEGVQYNKQRQDLPLGDKNYDVLGKQSDDMFQKALPEFEKANQLHPNDPATLRALVQVYTRTKQDDKAAATQKQLDALTGK